MSAGRLREGTFVNGRLQTIYYRYWTPKVETKAALLFNHGFVSHSNIYPTQFQRLLSQGIAIYLFDAHSFGRSDPQDCRYRSLVWRWQDLVDDIFLYKKEIVDKIMKGTPDIPLYLGGLSMGGMAAILAAIRDPDPWDGLILLSPAVDVRMNIAMTAGCAFVALLLLVAPESLARARLAPFAPTPEKIVLNEEARAMLAADPYFDGGNLRLAMVDSFAKGSDYIIRNASKLKLPTLLQYSTIDKMVNHNRTKQFSELVDANYIQIRTYDNAYHEIVLDAPIEVIDTVVDWVFRKTSEKDGLIDEEVKIQVNPDPIVDPLKQEAFYV